MNYDLFVCPECKGNIKYVLCDKCGYEVKSPENNIKTFLGPGSFKLHSRDDLDARWLKLKTNKFSTEMIKFVAKRLKGMKGRALDVGCGTGYYSVNIQRRLGNDVFFVGLDIDSSFDPGVVSENYSFVHADFFNHPFQRQSFDIVVNFDVIEHIEDDTGFVGKIIDLLKKDGVFIIGTPNGNRLPVKFYELIHGRRSFPFSYGRDEVLGDIVHVREYNKNTLGELFNRFSEQVEFEIVPFLLGSRIVKEMIGLKYPGWFFGDYCYYWWIIGKKIK